MSEIDHQPSPPVLDADHLSAMTGGDTGLAMEVIDIFRQQTEIWSRMLTASMPQRQWADAAHSLKGSALSVGAMRLSEACKSAETLGREDRQVSDAEAGVALSAVKDEIGPALEAAAHLAHQLSSSGRFISS
ncbi:MAG: Hpt domain-containing protein [Pseudomonadota bacterium]